MLEESYKDKSSQLDEKLFELQALFDLSKTLNSSLDLKTILDTVLLTPMGRMLIGKGMVLISEDGRAFAMATLKGLPTDLIGTTIEVDDFPAEPMFVRDVKSVTWRAFLEKHDMELVIPIKYQTRNLGVISFGKKIVGKPFSDSEMEYLSSLSNIAASAVQNALTYEDMRRLNRRLDRKVQELNTLFEIGKELNATLETDKIVNLLAYAIMGEMMVQRCLIFLKEEDRIRLAASKGLRKEDESALIGDDKLLAFLATVQQPLAIEEDDEDSEPLHGLLADRLVAVIPMRIQNETRGVVVLGEKITKQPFQSDELDFLTTLGNLSMISIENARLFEETLEKQRLEEELLIARDIQKRLLPKACPELENYALAAINLSSRQVGGDYYDCIEMDRHRYALCIADVSGKGVPASLLMANLQAGLHALVQTGLRVEEMVAKINNLIFQNTAYDKFITFFLGILDLRDNTLTSVNAGHNPPFLFHADGSYELLEQGGLLLGMMPDVPYEKEMVTLRPGDCLVMFTDGVSEAQNGRGEEFGEERIERCVQEHLGGSAQGILDTLIKAVGDFSKGQPQTDDITVLLLKMLQGNL